MEGSERERRGTGRREWKVKGRMGGKKQMNGGKVYSVCEFSSCISQTSGFRDAERCCRERCDYPVRVLTHLTREHVRDSVRGREIFMGRRRGRWNQNCVYAWQCCDNADDSHYHNTESAIYASDKLRRDTLKLYNFRALKITVISARFISLKARTGCHICFRVFLQTGKYVGK